MHLIGFKIRFKLRLKHVNHAAESMRHAQRFTTASSLMTESMPAMGTVSSVMLHIVGYQAIAEANVECFIEGIFCM